jgi:hypothetical protein
MENSQNQNHNTNLPNFTYEELELLLNTLVSSNPDNAKIKETNIHLKSYLKNIVSIEGFLLHIKNNQNFKIRQLACILMYRKFDRHFQNLEVSVKENVKNLLFELYLKETNFLVSKGISNLIYKTLRYYLTNDKESANQIFEYVLKDPQTYTNEEADKFVTNLNIVSELLENCFVLIEDKLIQMKNLISIAMKMGTDKIKEISAKCLGSFFRNAEKSDLSFLHDIIPNLINEMPNFNQETIMHIYENFCDFSGKALDVFKNHMEAIVDISLKLLTANDSLSLNNITLSVIAEFLILISESNKKFFKKNNCKYLNLALECGFKFCSEESESLKDNGKEENSPKCQIGERMIEEFSQLFPSKFVFDIAMKYIKLFITNENGFIRRQGIRAICCISESCSEKIKEHLSEFIDLLEDKFKNDKENKVKIACLIAIDNLSEFCYPQIAEYYDRILPISITGLFSEDPEIVANSLVAFKFYSQNHDVDLTPYVSKVLPRLIELLNSKLFYIQRDSLTALSAIVESSKDIDHNTLMIILETCKGIIDLKTNDADCEVRSCALICVAHIANAIKLEKFNPFLQFFSQIAFLGINSNLYEMQSAGFVYLKYISELLGDSFGNELDNIMPIAMKLLKDDSGIIGVKSEKEGAGLDDNDASDDDEDEEDCKNEIK